MNFFFFIFFNENAYNSYHERQQPQESYICLLYRDATWEPVVALTNVNEQKIAKKKNLYKMLEGAPTNIDTQSIMITHKNICT